MTYEISFQSFQFHFTFHFTKRNLISHFTPIYTEMRNEAMELWKIDLDLFTKMEREASRQRDSLPEAEVIEWFFQNGHTFEEAMEIRSRLKGDCRFKCWN